MLGTLALSGEKNFAFKTFLLLIFDRPRVIMSIFRICKRGFSFYLMSLLIFLKLFFEAVLRYFTPGPDFKVGGGRG